MPALNTTTYPVIAQGYLNAFNVEGGTPVCFDASLPKLCESVPVCRI